MGQEKEQGLNERIHRETEEFSLHLDINKTMSLHTGALS